MATNKSLVGNLTEAELKGKKVLLRADLNVPFDDDLNIIDDTLIRAYVPAIKFLTEKGAKVILASHLERPKGGVTPKYSLKPLVPRLSELLEVDVAMANECIEVEAQRLAASLPDGGVLFLEFDEEEEKKKDPEFANKLASVADISANVSSAYTSLLKSDEALPDILGSDILKQIGSFKHGQPDKTRSSHHILTGGGASSKMQEGNKGLSGAFAYDITSGGGSVVAGETVLQEGKVIHHIPVDDVHRARTKVQEGKGLSGVFVWDGDGQGAAAELSGLDDGTIEHI